MNKKFLPAFLVSFIVMFLLAFAWHQPIMGWFYADNPGAVADVTRMSPMVPPAVLVNVVLLVAESSTRKSKMIRSPVVVSSPPLSNVAPPVVSVENEESGVMPPIAPA